MLSVVSTAVYSLTIWTRDSRHSSSPGSILLTAVQISKQWKCSKITLDLSVERHEETSAVSLLSYSKYIVLSNHRFLPVCHGTFKRGVVLGLFVNDRSINPGVVRMYSLDCLLMIAQSVWALLECISCLTPSL